MIWTVLLIVLLLWALALLFAVLRSVFIFLGLRSRKKRHSSSRDWKRRRECLPLPDDVYRRPDPCIYAQYYLMSQGFAVTWDNPDIWLQLRRQSEKLTPTARPASVARSCPARLLEFIEGYGLSRYQLHLNTRVQRWTY